MNDDDLSQDELRRRAGEHRLHGLLSHWADVMADPAQARWVTQMLGWEAAERSRRSLERRLREARIGRFKPLADFDWAWPRQCDRAAVEELMTLEFLGDASNVVLVGPNGVGKTMCACNIGYQAVLAGHTALFTTAGHMLGELAALDSDSALRRKLRQYAAPDILLIDLCAELSNVACRAGARVDPRGRPSSRNITSRTVVPSSITEGNHAQR
ncbi:MAG: ATP-binding protein, partial [Burkholderiales bacterium]|nr:ATP-binding protein [Burkholderiales bacterium]